MTKTIKIVIGFVLLIAFFKGYLHWSDNHSRTNEITNLAPAANECVTVERRRPRGGAIVDGSKHYCLAAPLTVEGQYNSFAHGSKYYSEDEIVLAVAADGTTLDFRGQLVRSRANGVPVVEGARIYNGDSDYGGIEGTKYAAENWSGFFKNITVKNGRAELKFNGTGIYFPGDAYRYVDELKDRLNQKPIQPFRGLTIEQKRKAHSSAYNVDRNIVIDTMNIRSKDPGILIQGGRTVIRNSVIETDSATGILVFGSNAIIEGNTIIVHNEESSWWDDYGVVKRGAPIRLVYADGAIIRNNRIVMKGFAKGSALSITDSKTITFENNRIYGMDSSSPWAATFDGAEQPSAINTTFEPGWKAWFIGGIFNY